VVRVGDAKPVELGQVVQADGRWRLFLFADKWRPDNEHSMLLKLCDLLESADSPLRRYTPASEDIDSVFDVRAVFQQSDIDMLVVRPDQHVANVLPLNGFNALVDFFGAFMVSIDVNAQSGI